MKKLAFSIFLFAFLLIRPYTLQSAGMMYTGDDFDYFAHSASIVYGQFPSYDKEFLHRQGTPLGAVGSGLMAAPFVFAGSLIDRVKGASIVEQRTQINIRHSWSSFGFVVSSVFYFCLGCFLLFKGMRFHVEEKYAFWAVFLMVLCQGLPLFAFRRPVFSHSFEFFLQSILVYFLFDPRFGQLHKWRSVFWLGITVAFMMLVRYNNVFSALVWPFVLLLDKDKKKSFLLKQFLLVFGLASFWVVVFKFVPDILNTHHGYSLGKFLAIKIPSFYTRRILHILFGLDWGLIFTAPFILIALVSLFIFSFSLKKKLIVVLLPLIFNLYGIVMYGTQGGWYGYRYILAAVTPLLVYPLALFLRWGWQKYQKKFGVILCLIALFPLLSMLCFEGNDSTLTLHRIIQFFGKEDWGNNAYQLEIWKAIVFHPSEVFISFLKGGPLYLAYLVMVFLRRTSALPAVVVGKYPGFEWIVFIQMIILYCLPFLVLVFFRRKGGLKKADVI